MTDEITPEKQLKILANNIRTERENQGITWYELSKLSGVAANSIQAIEKGKVNPTVRTATKIVNALGMDLWSFCLEEE